MSYMQKFPQLSEFASWRIFLKSRFEHKKTQFRGLVPFFFEFKTAAIPLAGGK